MSRRAGAAFGLVAALALAGCTPGQPAVAVNDRVAAEDRTEEAAPGGEAGGGGGGGPVAAFAAGNQLVFSEAPPGPVPAGPLTFELTCESLPHDVTIEGENGDEPIVKCDGAGTETGDTELEPATYTYYCSVPGHRPAGMEGTLIVE